MIIEIFESVPTAAKPSEKVLVRLEKNGAGVVFLVACDAQGGILPRGYLLLLNSSGFVRQSGANPSLGFPLDSNGAVKIT